MFWTYSHAHAPGQDATAPTVTTNDSLQPETAPMGHDRRSLTRWGCVLRPAQHMRFPTPRSRLRGVWAALGRGKVRPMPRSPGGVSRVAHGAGPLRTQSGGWRAGPQSAPGTGWKPWNRRRDARRGPGGNLAPSLCGKLLLKRGPVSKFLLYPPDSISKIGGGHTAACCPGRVGQATRPPPPKVAHLVEALPARSGAC